MEQKDINITIEDRGANIKLIKLKGVLDTLTTPKLDEVMAELIKQEGLYLVANCSGLTYANSTGLASLILYHIQKKRRKGVFKLAALNDFIGELVDVSGAIKLLDIYKTEEEAIKDCESDKKSV